MELMELIELIAGGQMAIDLTSKQETGQKLAETFFSGQPRLDDAISLGSFITIDNIDKNSEFFQENKFVLYQGK